MALVVIQIGLKIAGKIRRFVRAELELEPNADRRGECDRCGLCCKILFRCPFYDDVAGCTVYDRRPGNCRVFPASPADLLEVARCSYTFAEAAA